MASNVGQPKCQDRAEVSFRFCKIQLNKIVVVFPCVVFSAVVHFFFAESASFVVTPWILFVYLFQFGWNLVVTCRWWARYGKEGSWVNPLLLEFLIHLTILGLICFAGERQLVLWSFLLPAYLLIWYWVGLREYHFALSMLKHL